MWYYFQSTKYWKQILEGKIGIGQPNVNGTKLGKLHIPLPPLNEQHRIVDKIEELFSELDNAIENLKKIKEQLKIYHQAVLKYAYKGKLTEEWRKRNNKSNWKQGVLKDISEIIMGQSPSSSTYNDIEIGLPFFQGKAEFGYIYPTVKKYCSNPIKIAEKNDVLISVRAPVGPTNLAPYQCCIGRGLAAIRPKKYSIYKFLLYFLRTNKMEIVKKGTGTTFKAISRRNLENLIINIPILEEQEQIVQEIESRLSQSDKIEQEIDSGLQQAELLKQSILKKAFEGKLVPQDPNDEPAAELLKHIKKEKEKLKLN